MMRIQRQRRAGWKMPPNTVYVGRPTKWGNPFTVGQEYMMAVPPEDVIATPNTMGGADFSVDGRPGIPLMRFPEGKLTIEDVLRYYKGHILERFTRRQIAEELGGKDLACWCPLGQPCHADVLHEMANADANQDADR